MASKLALSSWGGADGPPVVSLPRDGGGASVLQVPATMIFSDPVYDPNAAGVQASIAAANAAGPYNADPIFTATPAYVASVAKVLAAGLTNGDTGQPVVLTAAPAIVTGGDLHPKLTPGLIASSYATAPAAVVSAPAPVQAVQAVAAVVAAPVQAIIASVSNAITGAAPVAAPIPSNPTPVQSLVASISNAITGAVPAPVATQTALPLTALSGSLAQPGQTVSQGFTDASDDQSSLYAGYYSDQGRVVGPSVLGVLALVVVIGGALLFTARKVL